ncbi:MAG TPA: hypothetical protein VGJ41_16295 [Nocardioides sp.]|jgi:hypothetical protein
MSTTATRPPRFRKPLLGFVVGAVAAATVVGGTMSMASIPSSSSGKLTSCVSKKNGAVRLIDFQAGRRCSSTERTVSWFQGPIAKVVRLPNTGFPVDREFHKVGSATLPRAGTWTLVATTVVYTHFSLSDGSPRFGGSAYANCQLRAPSGKFLGGTDATTLSDALGNGFLSLTFNGALTVNSSARTVTLWCRVDNNDGGTTATASMGSQVLATRVAGFA